MRDTPLGRNQRFWLEMLRYYGCYPHPEWNAGMSPSTLAVVESLVRRGLARRVEGGDGAVRYDTS